MLLHMVSIEPIIDTYLIRMTTKFGDQTVKDLLDMAGFTLFTDRVQQQLHIIHLLYYSHLEKRMFK